MNKKCHTYYELISDINNNRNYDQEQLIGLCQRSWNRHGWDFKVLSEDMARQHSKYDFYKSIFASIPSANPIPYDYHCFMRWVAMVVVGGGIMIDYDVLNLGMTDLDMFNRDGLTIYQNHVPCVVSGTDVDFQKAIDHFVYMAHQKEFYIKIDDKAHSSDMVMLSYHKLIYRSIMAVVDYPLIGSLVHIPQVSCVSTNQSKFEIMEKLLQSIVY